MKEVFKPTCCKSYKIDTQDCTPEDQCYYCMRTDFSLYIEKNKELEKKVEELTSISRELAEELQESLCSEFNIPASNTITKLHMFLNMKGAENDE